MSDDWIKMRLALQTHPKIVRMMSALHATRFEIIGGLHAVWGVFDMHSEDGFLPGYTLEELDKSINWSGFSNAMIEIGWLVDKKNGLQAIDFTEHNGKSAKRRAEDTKRKKSVRNLSAICPQKNKKKSGPEKEKEKEKEKDIKTNTNTKQETQQTLALPDWLNPEIWNAWIEYRKERKKPLSKKAMEISIDELKGFRENGFDPETIIKKSIASGWLGLFETGSKKQYQTRLDQQQEFAAALTGSKNGQQRIIDINPVADQSHTEALDRKIIQGNASDVGKKIR